MKVLRRRFRETLLFTPCILKGIVNDVTLATEARSCEILLNDKLVMCHVKFLNLNDTSRSQKSALP